jgi:hypothetical protein
MIMMMTDPDRVALSAFLPAFQFRFIHPFMPTSTPTFHRNVPPCNLSHILLPHPILVFRFTSQQICLFSSHFSSTFWHARQALHHFSRLVPFVFCAAPLSRSSSKKLAIRVTSRPPPLFSASQHAYTHLRSIIYVSITRGGIYLAPKRRIC